MEKAKLIKQNLQKKVNREIWLLQKLKHQHLVRIYEAIIQERQIHVVMEFVPGGELFDLIANKGKMQESEARAYFQQVVSCLEYCHNRQIAHRDLKPENILLDETKRQVKVADFGLSNRMHDGRFLLTSCGSPNYAAPEVVSGKYFKVITLERIAAVKSIYGALVSSFTLSLPALCRLMITICRVCFKRFVRQNSPRRCTCHTKLRT